MPTDSAQQIKDDDEFWESTRELVEHWEQDLLQRGLEQGVQQGVQQGLERGERNTLLRQLRRRFGAEISAEIERRVATAPIAQIELWVDRVLSAVTLDELLAD